MPPNSHKNYFDFNIRPRVGEKKDTSRGGARTVVEECDCGGGGDDDINALLFGSVERTLPVSLSGGARRASDSGGNSARFGSWLTESAAGSKHCWRSRSRICRSRIACASGCSAAG
jgi:hypothetical protein